MVISVMWIFNSEFNLHELKHPILWVTQQKPVPPRPADPESYPEDDFKHWYDKEYAGWNVKKVNMPVSPANGPGGKNIICLLTGHHPYISMYERGMAKTASAFKINLRFKYSEWNDEEQHMQVEETIRERPDMIIVIPENTELSSNWYRDINEAGIPVIASNLMPEDEGFRYVLSWTGPDDWRQFRKLAVEFAERMDYKGGYCIVGHIPGTSAYYARRWAIITELNRIAPKMELLAMESTNLNTDNTYRVVKRWLDEFGNEIKGIVSADDNLAQIGINRALAESDREEIIRVASGSTQKGIRMLKDGQLDAITFQSAELDGALPIQVAVDWFNGLIVPPIKYLPTHILTRDNVEDFMFNLNNPCEIDLDYLYQSIIECNSMEVESFFDSLYLQFSSMGVLTVEYFRGFSIELLSNLLNIIKSAKLSEKTIIGDYETIFKKLFNQRTMELTLSWMKDVALKVIFNIGEIRDKPLTLIQQIVDYVNIEYKTPLSIKIISYSFNISAAYLGKLFKQETGQSFSRYLNNLRIERAKILLLETNSKANKIAIEVGYSDSNYFYNIFKKYTGMYPSEYLDKENKH